MLRLIAQDSRPQVAHAAIDRLAAAAAEPQGEACLRALLTLAFALPPEHAALVERHLRKLQFTGKRYEPPSAAPWQALLSPSDASGYSSVWFVRHAAEDAGAEVHGGHAGVWLGFILSVQSGILQFSGSEDMPAEYLPHQAAVGELVTVRTTGREGTVLLTAPFDVGRWLVRQALEARWRDPAAEPLPGEYTLFNDLLWEFGAPKLPPDLAEWWARATPPAASPAAAPDFVAVSEAATVLADDPAMEGWLRWSRSLWNSVKYRSQQPPAVPPVTLVSLLLRELVRMPDHRQLLQTMAAGLRVQTLWYAIAGSPSHATRAALLARTMLALPITDNPFNARLLEKGYGP
jgi:hypothetical protein